MNKTKPEYKIGDVVLVSTDDIGIEAYGVIKGAIYTDKGWIYYIKGYNQSGETTHRRDGSRLTKI